MNGILNDKLKIILMTIGVVFVLLLTLSVGVLFISQDVAHKVSKEEFKSLVRDQDVCSRTNQGEACRALFQRILMNVSDIQRKRLACDVLAQFPQFADIRQKNFCPAPVLSPPLQLK